MAQVVPITAKEYSADTVFHDELAKTLNQKIISGWEVMTILPAPSMQRKGQATVVFVREVKR
jgi:hypothetical protein